MPLPADLDPQEFDSLNREFYAADPAEVIERRVWMLVHYLGSDELTAAWPEEGFVLARDEAPSRKERLRFAALESTLVAHQAAETLLRLLLAHWDDAPCPWWELTRLRRPGAFPKGVRRIASSLDTDGTMAEMLRIVSWPDEEAAETGAEQEARSTRRQREGLRELVDCCCTLTLDGADLYNAGKHGLAILPGDDELQIGEDEFLPALGASLTVIERTEHVGEPRWTKATHWIEYQSAIAMSRLIASAIRSLWECGMQRRVGGGDPMKVAAFDQEEVERAWLLGSDPEDPGRMTHWSNLYDAAHPAPRSSITPGDVRSTAGA